MKKYAPFFIAMASVFSFGCFAQENAQLLSDNISKNDLVVVSYHVEERINMTFGSRVITYNVPSLSLVDKNELGPNNVRIVTPKYTKAKAKKVKAEAVVIAVAPIIYSEQINADDITATILNPVAPRAVEPAKKEHMIAYIDKLSTYERVLDKGYQSVDMLKRVGNNRFFEGNLVLAAKWYDQLFALTTDLDIEYYYRYAQSLKSVGQIEKASQMMAIFESKNSQE